MDYVFTNIGTSTLALVNLARKVSSACTLQDYVADVLEDARLSLAAFPHQQVLKALKDHPEGVSPAYFERESSKGVNLCNPADVEATMRSVNAIVYQRKPNKYMSVSMEHRTALQSYEPTIK